MSNQLLEELINQGQSQDLFSKTGLFKALKKQLIEKILEKELSYELGYDKNSKATKEGEDRRNRYYTKTLLKETGEKVEGEIPRNRADDYSPQVVPKGMRRFIGIYSPQTLT